MDIQNVLERFTMVTILCQGSTLAKAAENKPISGYLKPVDDLDSSFKLILWNENLSPEDCFFTTLDLGAVIREDIECLLNHVTGHNDVIVCKADENYRKERDLLRSSITRLQVILEKAVLDIDTQSLALEHDIKES